VAFIGLLTSGLARREGRRKTAFPVFAGVLCALLLALVSRNPVSADSGTTIGINMQPGAGTASSAGDSQGCVSVKAGDSFNADVFITNTAPLTEWELRVDYDPSIVSLESADSNYLLVASGGQLFRSDFEQEKPGRVFLDAVEPHSPDGGSGVLTRLHLKALSDGTSSLQITTNPSYFGPRLVGAGGAIVGDTNGDGIFDGAVTGGSVAVGRSCAPTTPSPVSTPAPGQASPTPGSGTSTAAPAGSDPGSGGITTAPGGDNSGGAGNGPGPGGSTTAPAGDNSSGAGNGQNADPASSPIVANAGSIGGSGPTGDAALQGGDSNTQNSNGSSTVQGTSNQDNSGSSTPILMAAAVFAALAILAGAGLFIIRLRWTR
jgi:hypothetical protein